MADLKQTGIKISQYQVAEANDSLRPNKLTLEHFLISYAPSYFGSTTINKNYQVPMTALRNDVMGYVGISNAKSHWRNAIKLWSGQWQSEDPTESYIATWTEEDKFTFPHDYIDNKHVVEQGIDKIFIIDNAPLPQTDAAKLDPNGYTKKLVTKDYIDDRFVGMPKIKTNNSTIEIFAYPCLYEIEIDNVSTIDIVDTKVDEKGRTFKEMVADKCVQFMLRIPVSSIFYEHTINTRPNTTFKVTYNGKDCTWGFRNEILMVVSRAKNEGAKDVWVKCFAEYIDGIFTVKCTNGLNVLEDEIITGAAGVVTKIDEVYDSEYEVPTEHAVVEYVEKHTKDEVIHVTQQDKDNWNKAVEDSSNSISKIKSENQYIYVSEKENSEQTVTLQVNETIVDDATKIPTVKAVYDYVNSSKGINYEFNANKGNTTKMRFLGKYVLLQETEDGIDLIFGPNNNPKPFNTLTKPTGDTYYLFKSSTDSYEIPVEAGKTYDCVVSNDTVTSIYLNGNGVEMSYGSEFTATCTISNSIGDDIVITAENIGSQDGMVTLKSNDEKIKLIFTDVHKNNVDNEADADYTPNYVRFKGRVEIDNSFMTNDGYYSVTVKIGDVESTSKSVFVYKPISNTHKPTISTSLYEGKTRTVSGITYDNSAALRIKVTDVQKTQQSIALNNNRLDITFSSNANYTISPNSSTYTCDNMALTSGQKDSDDAVYEMSEEKEYTVTGSGNNISKFNTTIYATPYEQTRKSSISTTKTLNSTNYIWTKGSETDSNTISNFNEDGYYRLLAYLGDDNKIVFVSDNYSNTAKLTESNYTNQLLVQGGYLKHPINDVTGTYNGVTNDRYYVRKVNFGGSDGTQIDTLSITWKNMGNSFQTGTKMFLAKDTESEIQELTAMTNQGINGCAIGKPQSDSWKVQPKGVWNVFANTEYYLIVAMTKDAPSNLGKLTIQ